MVSGVVVMIALASGAAAGQDVGGDGHPGGYVKGKGTPARPEHALPQRRLPPSQLPARVVLDRVEAARLKMEATGQLSKPGVPLQIGFSREVPMLRQATHASALLSWTSIPGGQIAAVSLTSPDALGMRLGLLVDQMPMTALLRFYAQGAEQVFEVSGQEIMETLARNRAAGDTSDEARTYWSPVIDGQEMTVEIELPAGVAPDKAMFSIPRVSHLFSLPLETRALQKQIGAVGSCNLDAMCYTSTWELESLATARMIYTKDGSSWLCTGTMMSDSDPSTDIPYFLTADHCLSTQTVASTLQTYWFYRASSCGSATLSPGTRTLTSGATLLYASSNTDTSFLRLNSPAPGGTWKSGWSTDLPVISTSIVGLHNPKGDLQKISFGTITDYDSCHDVPSTDYFACIPATSGSVDHLQVVWSQGTIEGGSSGSGLWAVSGSDHYLVGQLTGGTFSCVTPTATAFYGSFAVAYNAALSQWLGTTPLTDGVCGAADGGTFPTAPNTNLCSAGTPTSISGSGPWSWSCIGSNGGASATCSTILNLITYTITVPKAGIGAGTVTSSPSGINCGSTCAASFTSGTPVTLTATPTVGSTFVGWGGDCAADGTVTLDAVKTCAATFTRPLILSTTSLPAGEQGAAYGYALQAEDGTSPYTWSLGGSRKNKLPQGLTLTSDGTLSGIPTKAKTTSFTVQVTDATYALATKNLSLQIVKGVKFKTKPGKGKVETPYSATLQTTGGIAPLTFSLIGGALPPGLTLDPATGQISGTPTAAGTFNFQVRVASSGGSSAQKDMRIKIKRGKVNIPPVTWPTISLTPVVSGFSLPILVTNAGDGSNRMFIVEQGGTILIYKNNALNGTPFLNMTGRVNSGGERGLLSLAFPPNYARVHHFYVFYTDSAGALTISRFGLTGNPDVADATSEQIVLSIPHSDNTNHNGGMLAFSPDGHLYFGSGDGGGGEAMVPTTRRI